MSVSNEILLNKFKKRARALQLAEGLSRNEALRRIANVSGYVCWSSFKSDILKGAFQQDSSKKKFYAHEADSSVNSNQIRGFSEAKLQIRDSFISLVGYEFSNLSKFTTEIHKKIKEVISNANEHVAICITFWIPTNVEGKVQDWDSYFDSIRSAFPQYLFFEYRFTDEPFRYGDEFTGFADKIYKQVMEHAKNS